MHAQIADISVGGKHTITLSANAGMKIGALFTRDETKQTLRRAK